MEKKCKKNKQKKWKRNNNKTKIYPTKLWKVQKEKNKETFFRTYNKEHNKFYFYINLYTHCIYMYIYIYMNGIYIYLFLREEIGVF